MKSIPFWSPDCHSQGKAEGRASGTLRITIQLHEHDAVIKLEGRVTGPWAEELDRAWKEQAHSLAARRLSLDLRDITYSDSSGTDVLREIYSQTRAELVAGNPWTHFLAQEVMRTGARSTLSDR